MRGGLEEEKIPQVHDRHSGNLAFECFGRQADSAGENVWPSPSIIILPFFYSFFCYSGLGFQSRFYLKFSQPSLSVQENTPRRIFKGKAIYSAASVTGCLLCMQVSAVWITSVYA